MFPTDYPDVNDGLNILLAGMQRVLGKRLIGLYLYGSLVMGDFDEASSDIDLLAAVASDLTDAEFTALDTIQQDFLAKYPHRKDRLEIAYLSLHALQNFKTESSKIGIISPGEPFHIKDAGGDWIINWHIVRTKGLTLFGPPPTEVITPTSQAEFIQTVKDHLIEWRIRVDENHSRPSQAYVIITVCRGMYTLRHGEQVSKLQAALWAMKELPEWSPLIENALMWRKNWREAVADPEATFPETKRFVLSAIDKIFD